MQFIRVIFLLGLFSTLSQGAAMAENRVALVIGNSAYQHSAHLKTPASDATQLASALKGLGFSVMHRNNLDGEGFADTMAAFAKRLQGADVALLYFGGHGLQFRGENYLVPIDARLKNEFTLKRETFPISDILEQMEAANRINLVFLDASRDNPLATRLQRSMSSTRSANVAQGLGHIPTLRGETLVVHAAAPGYYSIPGKDKNSPFASALLKHIATPGLEIEVMLKRVTGLVRQTTKGRQNPLRLSRLTGEFYFRKQDDNARLNREQNNRVLNEMINRVASLQTRLKQHRAGIPELVYLKGGVFQMGCLTKQNCQHDEFPAHQVKLDGFSISKYEITFDQWDACVAQGACSNKANDAGWGRGNRPVINVSWLDATRFAKWLGKKTGHSWRLPTEAEWEYAARAGTKTSYAFGDRLSTTEANFGYQQKKTMPVGHYPPNQFGLHDMHGNVWEWVGDKYGAAYYKDSPVQNPTGPIEGSSRVFRGGSWLYKAINLRSSDRNAYSPDFRSKNIGFRLVREQ